MGDMPWWQHPMVLVVWSVAVLIVYALFPSSDVAAVIALVVWGFVVIVWMAACDADFGSDMRAIWKDLMRRD